MTRKLIAGLLILLAVACAPQQPQASTEIREAEKAVKPVYDQKLSTDPAACRSAGGEIQRVCLMGNPMCIMPFKDAGKTCTDSDQCMGRCLGENSPPMNQPATGKCAPTNYPCGCFTLISRGIAQPALCVD